MFKSLVVAWLGTGITFAVLDLIWLTFVAQNFYRSQLGELRADAVNIPAATAFYLVMVTGIVFFAVLPALKADSLWLAVGFGALLGFLCYATYDLTNLATLRNWPVALTFVDLLWGTLLTTAASAGGFLAWQLAGGKWPS